MKLNNMKRFSVALIVLWTALESCPAQTVYFDSGQTESVIPPPGASDQQTQTKDLTGKRGQDQVDLFTGSFTYSVPIACAPARNGSEPNLTLGYSSGGENDWCGMGWKLDIGFIERNTKDGFPMKYSTANPQAPLDQYDDSKGFILNLFGKEFKLLPTAITNEFDAEVDTEFLHCILDTTNDRWLVYDKSGDVYYFGQTGGSRTGNTKSGWNNNNDTNAPATFHWALDQVITASGDWTTIAYTNYTSPFTSVSENTLYPTQITYNGHTNFNTYSANFTGTNKIIFQTDLRTNDWHFSYRSGFRTEQDRRLTNILCQVGSQNVWSYRLNYGISPATDRSLLTNVVLSGFDAGNNPSTLLTNTFAYQGAPVSFGSTITWTNMNLVSPDNVYYEPYVTGVEGYEPYGVTISDLVDIDGDGLPDRVDYDDNNGGAGPYKYQVQRNVGLQSNGNGSFGTRYSFGPTSSGGGPTASASNPIPDNDYWAAMNSQYVRLRDINGDGLPDRVCDWWAYGVNVPNTFTNFMVMTNTGSGFASVTAWPVSDGPAAAAPYGDLNLYQCVESGGVNSGFFDINGDGLPDRVMSPYYTLGAMTNFTVQFNTGTNFTPAKLFGPYHSQNWNSNPNSYYWTGIEVLSSPNRVHMTDINGDGLPDRVMLPMDPNNPINPVANTARTNFAVEFDDGYSFEAVNTNYTSYGGAADKWLGVNPQISGNADYAEIQNPPYVGLYDMNGDGLPDRVMLDDSTWGTSSTQWRVYLNNGHGFDTTPIEVSVYAQGQYSDPGWWGIESSYDGNTEVTLMDINGDGLLDRVMAVYENGYYGTWYSCFLVQLNNGPYPDLMTNVNNGLGGNIGVTYKPSTAYPNYRDPNNPNGGSLLPFPKQTVSTITESDGINPPRTTSYGYSGGFYDGHRREFHGFATVTVTNPPTIGISGNRRTVYYFHQGGGQDHSSIGEYLDPGNFAKDGMAYRIETYGNDNQLYNVVVNQVNQASLGNARYFPFVQLKFDCDYPGGGTPKITATQFVYDTSTGNVTNEIDYGQVTGFNPASVGSFSFTDADGTDTKYHNTHYATINNNNYIVDHPDDISLTDTNYNIVQEQKYNYNDYSGTIAAKLTRISAGYYATNSYGDYTIYGLVGLTTDPVGVQTEITYDSTYNTYPATTTIGGSFTTTTAYDPRSGQLAVSTDISGVTMSNSFDIFLRPTEVDKIPVGGGLVVWVEKISYPAVLKPIVSGIATNYIDVTDNDGVGGVESRTYVDGFDRPIQTIAQGENGNYRMVATAYDERGETFLTTWPIFVTSTNFSKPASGLTASWIGFDAAGRVATNRPVNVTFDSNGAFSSKTDLTGDSGSPLGAKTWNYVNGTDPWWVICTDEDGQVRRYGLDAFGRTNQIQEVDGSSTYTNALKYDLADNLTNIVNANGENFFWAFDDAGSVVAMADPYLGQWTYQRDYAGRVRVQTDGRGDVVKQYFINPTTGYQDPLGRLQWKEIYSTNYTTHSLALYSTVTNIYDSSDDGNYTVYPGLLYEVIDSQGLEKNGYDTRARTIKTTRHLNINNQDYTTGYTLDDGDNVTSTAYPNSGPTVTNSYWHGGSIHQVSLFGGGINYYTANASVFDEFEHVTNFLYGNGLTTTRGYYSVSKRLQSISSGSVFSRNYQYTAGDDVTSISGTGISGTMSVTYANLHRIKTYSGLSGNYGYDPVGTITNNIEGGGSSYYLGNARKQAVKSAFGMTNLYDLCGNMIVRHGGTTNSQAMTYDPENQLSVFSQAGAVVLEYGYAWDGARLWKRIDQSATNVQVWIGNIYEEKCGKILFHVFAGSQQVCTFEPTSPLNGGGDSSAVGYYYHEDSLNTSSALSSSTSPASQVEVNVYYPFGSVQTDSKQASFQVSRRFTGQVYDAESGLYYYNARYYDPELGRFTQPDTEIPDISNPQSYNRYSYVLNDPLRYTDPDGHWGQEVADWWSGTVSAGASYITASSSHWIWNGTVGTVNSLVGGVAAPLTLGTSAGHVSGNPNATGKDYAIATVTEAANVAAIVPVTAAGGKAVSTLVRAGEKEAAGEIASNFTADLSKTSAKSRSGHSYAGNKQLNEKMAQDPEFRAKMEEKYGKDVVDRTSTSNGGRRNPQGAEWHHDPNDPNKLHLLDKDIHRAPENQNQLHPDGQGGWSRHHD
jgi:RHS repeat-associated protein